MINLKYSIESNKIHWKLLLMLYIVFKHLHIAS